MYSIAGRRDRSLRRNQDRQDARYPPPLRLLDHHQIDVETDLGRFGAGLSDRELCRGIDLRHAAADRDHPEFLSIGLDVPRALVALLEALEDRLPSPHGLAPGDPQKIR